MRFGAVVHVVGELIDIAEVVRELVPSCVAEVVREVVPNDVVQILWEPPP